MIINRLEEITSKDIWEKFVTTNNHDTFLQSWSWGEFQKSQGVKAWRIGFYNNSCLVAVCLIVKVVARRGIFLFVPHGPVISKELHKKISSLVICSLKEYLVDKGKFEGCSFVRIGSTFMRNQDNAYIFNSLNFRKAPIHIHSELSWVLDLSPQTDALLKQMRKSTRNLIKNPKKYSVNVRASDNKKALKVFLELYNKTIKRTGFVGYSNDYIKNEFSAFKKDGGVSVYTSYVKGEPVASAFIIKYGSSGFYHHGATNLKYPKIPSSHLLQWCVIQDLKKRGFKYYNFWGVAPRDRANHPWHGLTVFKRGFGGSEHIYLQTQDYIINWKYWITWIIETARRIKRKY